jgi:predicted MPP superfamily phosphohydrolase
LAFECEWLSTERHALQLPNWTAGKLRLAVLGDFHIREQANLDRAVRALLAAAAERPDFLLLVGDFVEGSGPGGVQLLNAFLPHVKALPFPSIAVFGNHDTIGTQTIWLVDVFDHFGIPLLRNEMLDYGGVLFAGFEDGIHGEPRPELFGPDEAPRNVVALMHEPVLVEQMPRHFSLQVSGHTHGGQICLPGGIHFYRPPMSGRYTSGFYPNARVPLYVTRGIGTTGFPMRAYCRPEVTILDVS